MATRDYTYYFTHKEVAQRSLEWHRQRFDYVLTGSILGTVLLCVKYASRDKPRDWRGTDAEWNRQVLYETYIGKRLAAKPQDTGNLFNDHMRRGTLLERAVAWIMEQITGFPVMELPSIPLADGLMSISPDGLDANGFLYEIKCPMKVTPGRCKVHTDAPGERCQDCARAACGIYWHQAQAELAAVPDAHGLFFVQLRTVLFVHEVLGLRDGIDKDSGVVADFYKAPQIPFGMLARNLVEIVYVEREAGWMDMVRGDLVKFKDSVIAGRAERGLTFEKYAAMNGLE